MSVDLSKKTILIVEDDSVISNIYKHTFKSLGINVVVAEDGEMALEIMKKESIDFVILDIRMPKVDGIEVLKQMRADPNHRNTPVLILTNHDLREYRDAIKNLNVLDFIVKVDVEIKNVVEKVEAYLNQT